MSVWIAGQDRNTGQTAHRTKGAAGSAISVLLLLFQPVLFFWRVVINPQAHIPYDIEGFHFPLIAYVARCLREHIAPLWDPYSMCGMPIHADLQAQVFYPFTWLAILAGNLSQGRDLYYWVECLVPLHMALAGLFTFLLLRKMGLCRPAAFLGASVYQLGGFFASQTQHLCAICTAAWLPLAILAVFELRHGFRLRWFSLLAMALALSVLSGFAATALIVGAAMVLVVATLLITREANSRILPAVAAACIFAVVIAAVEVAPLWTLTNASVAAERARWHAFGGGLPIAALVSLVFPDYYHIFEFPALYTLSYNFTFLYVYCGLATLVLIALAPVVRSARAAAFFVLTGLSVLWMLGENTPVYRWIYLRLPELLRGALYAEYALMAFCFFGGITAAIVLDRFRSRVPLAILWAIALFTSYDLIHTGAGRPMNTAQGGYKDHSFWTFAREVSADLKPVLDATQPAPRIDYTDRGFPQGYLGPGMLGLPTSNGDNPFMLSRMLQLRRLFGICQPWERLCSAGLEDMPLLNMMNVAFVAGLSPLNPDVVKKAGLEPLQPIGGINFYRNPGALPRFFLAARVHRSPGENETFRVLAQPSFDPATEAVVEGIGEDRAGLASGEVAVRSYATNRIELTVATGGPAFLVTSETMYPGWEATVNGVAQPILMTNGVFRGLMLPPGQSRVVMEYRPRFLLLWGLLSIFSSIAALVGIAPSKSEYRAAAARWRGLVNGLGRRTQEWETRLLSAAAAQRTNLAWLSLLALAIAAFYWKILFTSRYSLLTSADAVNGAYSHLQFWVYQVRHGSLPLWDPYVAGGQSFCAQIENAAFYPLHLLLALAPFGRTGMLSPHLFHLWFVFVHVLGACFLWALAREFRLDRFSALVAGICFSLGGFTGGTGELAVLESAIWLPLLFLFLLRALRSEDRQAAIRNSAMAGAVWALSILAGGAGVAALQGVVILPAVFVSAKTRSRSVWIFGGIFCTALLAAAIQILPAAGAFKWRGLFAHAGGASVSPYFGILPLLLAAIGAWKNWRNVWVRYLCGLAVGGLLCALVVRQSLYLTGFAAALLAGFGTATLLDGGLTRINLKRVIQTLLAATILSGSALLAARLLGLAPATGEIALPLLMIVLSCGILQLASSMRLGAWQQLLLVAVLLLDLTAIPGPLRNRYETARSGVNQLDRLFNLQAGAYFLARHPVPFRVQIEDSLSLNLGDNYRLFTVEDRAPAPRDLLSVRYRILPAASGEPGAIYRDDYCKIYERPGAYPRAWMVHQAEFAPTKEAQLARVGSSGFDAMQSAVVDGVVKLEAGVKSDDESISFLNEDANRVDLDAQAKGRGLLVVSEQMAPGWNATVNGQAARIFRVDGVLRGIEVGRGENQVVLDYSPWTVWCGGLLSAAAIMGLLLLWRWRGRT